MSHESDQRERALGTWILVVEEDPAQPERLEVVRKALRLKRFEAQALAARLPGVVRRGARVDLAPVLSRLQEAGVQAQLIRR